MTLELHTDAFQQGATIPTLYTGEGADLSPPLKWSFPPLGTQSFVLICDDPDAPRQTYTHWLVFNLPAETQELAEGVTGTAGLPNGTRQGTNDFGQLDYGGPLPPPGSPPRYFFKLYALDCLLKLASGATKHELLEAMKGHILDDAEIMGIYER